MRFKKILPKWGQTRYVKKFALFPVLIRSEEIGRIREWLWLEWYWQEQCTHGNYHWSNTRTRLPCKEWTQMMNSEQKVQECDANPLNQGENPDNQK